jgi:lysophospholipase L1-like esterase
MRKFQIFLCAAGCCFVLWAFIGGQAPSKPVLLLIGDSTVKNGSGKGDNGQWGWGDHLAYYFDTARIEIANRALGGRSSRTFISEGLWEKALATVKAGDFVLIQFGHNDGSPVNDTLRARGTIKGIGEETEEIDNLITRKHEVVHSYGWYLRKYIRDAKTKGATPVVLSPIPRNNFVDGKAVRNADSYGGWAKQVAEAENVPFIDLNGRSAAALEQIAADAGQFVIDSSFYRGDHTHTSLAGAKLNARMVAEGIMALTDCRLKEYLFDRTYVFGDNSPEGIRVTSSHLYGNGYGYGFDLAPPPVDAAGACIGDSAFFFSVDLPEGDYDVTVTAGNPSADAEITVRGESRRLLVEKAKTEKGRFNEHSFTVNIRNRHIDASHDVGLKPRETNKLNWDGKLTLEFNGVRPGVRNIRIKPAGAVQTVFLCGNSTVTDQDNEPWCGWGQMIPRFFGQGVSFANYAESGESAGSFISAGRLKKLLTQAKAGDYIFVEFGHNDQKQQGEGVGAWTSFTQSLKTFITEARNKGCRPVLLTPVQRRSFDENGKIVNTHGEYPDAVRKLAADENVPLIDLHQKTKVLYEALGVEKSIAAFVHYPAGTFLNQEKALEDNTHFNSYGGYEVARCVVEGIRENSLADILRYLHPEIQRFDTRKPVDPATFSLPASPFTELEKPVGN